MSSALAIPPGSTRTSTILSQRGADADSPIRRYVARQQVEGFSNSKWKKSATYDGAVTIWNEMCERYHAHEDSPGSSPVESPPPSPSPPTSQAEDPPEDIHTAGGACRALPDLTTPPGATPKIPAPQQRIGIESCTPHRCTSHPGRCRSCAGAITPQSGRVARRRHPLGD
jgi:hypothetical protein